MWLRDVYSNEFEGIVDLVWDTYNKQPTDPTQSYLLALKEKLLSFQDRCHTTFAFQREDVEQELSVLWLRFNRNYRGKRTPGELKDYLLKHSVFSMKGWFFRQISALSHGQSRYVPNWTILEFQLDLKFLLEGTDYWPLCNLSPYERYLIFLKFKEEKSIVDMAYTVQKHREVVAYQLKRILNRLRSEINESKNTKRYSYPRPGL